MGSSGISVSFSYIIRRPLFLSRDSKRFLDIYEKFILQWQRYSITMKSLKYVDYLFHVYLYCFLVYADNVGEGEFKKKISETFWSYQTGVFKNRKIFDHFLNATVFGGEKWIEKSQSECILKPDLLIQSFLSTIYSHGFSCSYLLASDISDK